MTFTRVAKLADKFAIKLQKLAQDHSDELASKVSNLVKYLFPFVADNLLQDKGDHYEVVIEVMSVPDASSDLQPLSHTEFLKLVKLTSHLLKNNLHATDISTEDTAGSFINGKDSRVIAVKGKIHK
jgi:hypothetical protein